MLTTRKIETSKPAGKPIRLFDTAGLYCEVAPGGGKWWRFRCKFQGKEKRISLGVFPEVSLLAARTRRDELRALLRDGVDPAARRRAIAQSAAPQAIDTFESIAREWHSQQRTVWSAGRAERVLHRPEEEIFRRRGSSRIECMVQMRERVRRRHRDEQSAGVYGAPSRPRSALDAMRNAERCERWSDKRADSICRHRCERLSICAFRRCGGGMNGGSGLVAGGRR